MAGPHHIQRATAAAAMSVARTATWGAVLGVLAGVVAFAPAPWLGQVLAASTNRHLQLANATGTVWQGQAELLITPGAGPGQAVTLPQGLSWQWEPIWAGVLPGLQLQVQMPCCATQALTWRWMPGALQGPSMHLQGMTLQLPLSLVQGLGAPWNTLQPQGQVQANVPALRWHQWQAPPALDGPVQLVLLNLSSSLSTLRPLGSYQVDIAVPAGQEPRIQVTTLQGKLQLSGEGRWTTRGLRFTGMAETDAQSVDALSNLLNLLGRRDGLRSHLRLG